MPWPLTWGLGSCVAMTQRAMPAAMRELAQGGGAAVVAAGFERDVGGGALSGDSSGGCLLEGDDLGVVEVVVDVCAFGEDLLRCGRGRSRPGDWVRPGRWCRWRA